MNGNVTQGYDLVVIGGGAAGYFTALRAKSLNPGLRIVILERGKEVLEKVRISGGGRCNVTHACFDPRDLVKYYPRGQKELLGPFHRFACGDTMGWFEERGVPLKIEDDGRVFPVSDSSHSILDTLEQERKKLGIQLHTSCRVDDFSYHEAESHPWRILTAKGSYQTKNLLLTTGSNPRVWDRLAASLEVEIIPPVPSLFTFHIKDARLQELAGLSMPHTEITLEGTNYHTQGPTLITHWGLSGPAVLKLSAWAARELAAAQYQANIRLNWIGIDQADALEMLQQAKTEHPKKQLGTTPKFGFPARLWDSILRHLRVPEQTQWANASTALLQSIAAECTQASFRIHGKSTFKEEFVTAGGIDLRQIDFKSFSLKKYPSLYVAGEILNIDAVTGGFNFQAAWTGGWIAGEAIAGRTDA